MADRIENKLAEAKRTADAIVETLLPWIEMVVADESDSHLTTAVDYVRQAAQKAADHYTQRGQPIPAHVLAVLRNPFSKPSEQTELGPGAVRLPDINSREVVRCKSCDWVQFRSPTDECTRCGIRFDVEPKSGDSPVSTSSIMHLWESSESEGHFLDPSELVLDIEESVREYERRFINISPDVLKVIARKGTSG